MGYLKAGSTASLIAGGISGVLLLVAAFLLPSHVVVGLVLGDRRFAVARGAFSAGVSEVPAR